MVILNYLVMCTIFGTTFLAIKIGIDAGTPLFFSAGLRFILAGMVLFSWMMLKKRASLSLLLQKEMWLTGIGLTFGTFAMLYWAEQYVTSGTAAILSATAPMIILLLQGAVLRERVTGQAITGCLIGLMGVILLVLPQVSIQANTSWLLGCVTILLGQIFYASGVLYSKRVIGRFSATSPIALNAAQMMSGGALLILLSLFTEPLHMDSLRSMLSFKAIGSLVYLIVAGSMVAHTIFYWLVAKTNPVFPSTWLYISPVIAMVLGMILYNEAVTWYMAAGAVMTIMGIIVVNVGTLRQMFQKPLKARNMQG